MQTKKEDKEVAKIAANTEPHRKRIKVNTKNVFVEADKILLPKGFISKSLIKEDQRKRLIIEEQFANSCYKRRMNYDERHKEVGGNRVPMPT